WVRRAGAEQDVLGQLVGLLHVIEELVLVVGSPEHPPRLVGLAGFGRDLALRVAGGAERFRGVRVQCTPRSIISRGAPTVFQFLFCLLNRVAATGAPYLALLVVKVNVELLARAVTVRPFWSFAWAGHKFTTDLSHVLLCEGSPWRQAQQ